MLAIRVGQLIDGNGGPPLRDALILVRDERILKVGLQKDIEVPPGTEIMDFSDATAMPGMIDCHVHVHVEGGPATNFLMGDIAYSQGFLALQAYQNAKRDIEMGFTSLRTLGSPAYVDIALREAINAKLVEGPRIIASGQGISVTGGHMDIGHWAPEINISGRTGVCDGPWECRRAVREQIKRGADLIKTAFAGGIFDDLTEPGVQEMTFEEMEAICDEAHRLRKRVAAHAHGGQGITDAIRAGVDSIEHGLWLTEEQVDMMADNGVFYVPTLSCHTRGLELGPGEEEGKMWNWLVNMCEMMWISLELAKKAGVKIAVGTDAGFWIYHGENAKELSELVKGGFTSMEAIVAATRTGAECLDIDNDTGTIEEGKYADIVVIDGDPLADITILQDKDKIIQVLKGGQKVA